MKGSRDRRPRASTVEPVLRLMREAICQTDGHGVIPIARPVSRLNDAPGPDEGLCLPAPGEPFHFTHRLTLLCEDICARVEAFRHIDMQRVLVTFARARKNRLHGLQAKLVPLRFRGGERIQARRGGTYQVQKLVVGDVELLYVMTFYLPRFLNQCFDEKIITVFHELYHIGPDFRGDIRRFDQRGSVHAGSQREYDRHMASLARSYFAGRPPRERFDFLRLSFEQIRSRYGEVVGLSIPAPKLLRVGSTPGVGERPGPGMAVTNENGQCTM